MNPVKYIRKPGSKGEQNNKKPQKQQKINKKPKKTTKMS